ncbi:hypothetical protein DPMN_167839 [Dreissena polymorpha]|uniref:Uncharacterized protein n=1 Tax=Dreissena polymorpha TaxID=45954 RepID=A0A9D4F0Y9_DREPO|nr:hypothetical protein DPMN_167839 [Dreissena polymorpha]
MEQHPSQPPSSAESPGKRPRTHFIFCFHQRLATKCHIQNKAICRPLCGVSGNQLGRRLPDPTKRPDKASRMGETIGYGLSPREV